jgi:hypothetical protein
MVQGSRNATIRAAGAALSAIGGGFQKIPLRKHINPTIFPFLSSTCVTIWSTIIFSHDSDILRLERITGQHNMEAIKKTFQRCKAENRVSCSHSLPRASSLYAGSAGISVASSTLVLDPNC